MAIPIPTALVEFILLGPLDDRRQLQDSPILGDVWVAYGKSPGAALDLLISPFRTQHAGSVAGEIEDGLVSGNGRSNIAYLQGLVVARLTFEEVLRVVVPLTSWWINKWTEDETQLKQNESHIQGADEPKTEPPLEHELSGYNVDKVVSVLDNLLRSATLWHLKEDSDEVLESPSPLDRFVALMALIVWAGDHPSSDDPSSDTEKQISLVLRSSQANLRPLAQRIVSLIETMLQDGKREQRVWQVSLNRSAMPALTKSIPAVKADAAKTLFKVNCKEIAWAVIDSGIDGEHPAFKNENGTASRVARSFDFKNFRNIVSLSNAKDKIRSENVELLLRNRERLLNAPTDEEANSDLLKLAKDARSRGPVRWDLVEKFVEIKPGTPPPTNHGTHVAGIIGASKEGATIGAGGKQNDAFADGMCPEISLYDFRVLAPSVKETEFAIIAALQFIRYLNDRDNFFTIHGANLSLSIPHDVRNFACGRTPICNECERLVESGVVVVAAAGNHGYKSFETKEGSFDSYAAFSITDPGNADGVVTVGATHRFWPHTYGVSFFSSRGPTGDGRIKPDLVAPGERIRAPLPGSHARGGAWGDLDGTSMAAPHVSGAAAMLMARYSELIGQPRRIKQILCDSATDLKRERSFQGHGMLDVLRAFQSI
jgi:hypothetical protein